MQGAEQKMYVKRIKGGGRDRDKRLGLTKRQVAASNLRERERDRESKTHGRTETMAEKTE